jgi:spore coat protein JC
MWIYEKKLQYPVKIKTPNAGMAKIIITQYGGLYGNRI